MWTKGQTANQKLCLSKKSQKTLVCVDKAWVTTTAEWSEVTAVLGTHGMYVDVENSGECVSGVPMSGWRQRKLWVLSSGGRNRVEVFTSSAAGPSFFTCPRRWARPPRLPFRGWPPGCVCFWIRSRRSPPPAPLCSGCRWVQRNGSAWGSPGLHSWRASVDPPGPERQTECVQTESKQDFYPFFF